METEVKELEKLAKQSEKENPDVAIKLYKDAAALYEQNEETKYKNSSLERAAKILKEQAKSLENPVEAYDLFKEAMRLYNEIGKDSEADKINSEAQKKFLKSAKDYRNEAKKTDDLDEAEEKFSLAAYYYEQGDENDEGKKCLIESAEKFHKTASDVDDPVEAHELFNRAIINYRRANSEEGEHQVIGDSAAKFYYKGSAVIKEGKNLVQAYYYLSQSLNLSMHLGDPDKQIVADEKLSEVLEIIGMSDDILFTYLESQGMNPVSIVQDVYEEPNINPTKVMEQVPPMQDSSHLNEKESEPQAEDKIETIDNINVNNDIKEVNPSANKVEVEHSSIEDNNSMLNIEDIVNRKPDNSIRKRIKQEFLEGRKIDESHQEGTNDLEIEKLMNDSLVEPITEIIDPKFNPTKRSLDKPKIPNVETQPEIRQPEIKQSETEKVSEPNVIPENNIDSVSQIQNKLQEAKLKLSKPQPEVSNQDNVIPESLVTESNIQTPVMADKLPESIIAELKAQGYLNRAMGDEDKFVEIPEYQTLSFIINHHPISLEDIESNIKVASISMVLSNLTADGLVEQTNDYRYTITQNVESKLASN